MANTQPITEQDIESVDALLHELKDRAAQAHQQNKTVILGVYTNLIRIVSPEVRRLHNRMEREDLADFNKKHKGLRHAEREQSNGA